MQTPVSRFELLARLGSFLSALVIAPSASRASSSAISPFWMQNYHGCDHVRIRGIRVFNHGNVNNDMLDLTDCHDVVVFARAS